MVFIWEFLAKTDTAKNCKCCFFFCRKRWQKRVEGEGRPGAKSVIDETGIHMAVNPLSQNAGSRQNVKAEVSDEVYNNLTDAQDALRKAKKQIDDLNAQLRIYKKDEMTAFKPKKRPISKKAVKKAFGQGERKL